MTSHGKHVVPNTHSMRKLSRDNPGLFHDTVTARTISRLSQGVARMTANDSTEPNTSSLVKSSSVFTSVTQHNGRNLQNTDLANDISSTFGLFTQRSSLNRARFPLPLLNTGSKRSFNYVIGASRILNMRSSLPIVPITSRRQSYLTRFQQEIICDDAKSSDSSMLSITPPRSEPTASSSPNLSTSMDESHSYCFYSLNRHKRWRRRLKDRHHRKRYSHSTGVSDCRWNDWRSPNSLLGERTDHRSSRRVDILGDDDSSEEGPVKKARVTEKVFENPYQDRCLCCKRSNHPRRTASLSPKRTHHFSKQHEGTMMMTADSRIYRKPMKFRKSLLATRAAFSRNLSMHFESSNENHSPEFSTNRPLNYHWDEDADGDDECSDTSPCKR